MTPPPADGERRSSAASLPDNLDNWALFLDVDGTLLDIAPSPDAVAVSEALRSVLTQLEQRLGGAVALISGRTIANLDELFAPLRLATAGLHGAEWRQADGVRQQIELDPVAMDRARAQAAELADQLPGVLLEDKGLGVALHYRQAPQCEEQLRKAVHGIGEQTGVVVQPGKCVFELKPAGVNKGIALRRLCATAPFAGRPPLFIGDDLTDAFAIEAAQALDGLGIAVGETLERIADGCLADPDAVLVQLQRWSSA